MKKLSLPLLFALSVLTFGFIPTEAKAQYHRGSHCEQVVRYYDHCDGWRYKVVRYFDRHCGQWRERHIRVSRCRPRYRDHHRDYGYNRGYRTPRYRSSYGHRSAAVNIGGVRFVVDSRRGLNRSCR